jgi:hypothetical protein
LSSLYKNLKELKIMDNSVITFTATSVDKENQEYISFSLDGKEKESLKAINLYFQFTLFLEKLGITAETANTSYLDILNMFGTLDYFYSKVKNKESKVDIKKINDIDKLKMMEINSYEHFENLLLTDKALRCFLYDYLKEFI